jgi:hypothetical protein
MKRYGPSLVALCLLAVVSSRASADLLVIGTLTGPGADPPNFITPAVGTFTGSLDVSGSTATLTFSVTFPDIDHDLIGGFLGASFQDFSGPFTGDVRNYDSSTDPGDPSHLDSLDLGPTALTGTWSSSEFWDPFLYPGENPLTPALVSDLFAGNIYFDIQTEEFPTGEVRGQLAVVPEPSTLALSLIGIAGLAAAAKRRRARQVIAG